MQNEYTNLYKTNNNQYNKLITFNIENLINITSSLLPLFY